MNWPLRSLKGDELWFHAKISQEATSSLQEILNPSDEVKTDAAELAAYYSKARLSNLVQVDMIEAKKLNKPTGGKPGLSPTPAKRLCGHPRRRKNQKPWN